MKSGVTVGPGLQDDGSGGVDKRPVQPCSDVGSAGERDQVSGGPGRDRITILVAAVFRETGPVEPSLRDVGNDSGRARDHQSESANRGKPLVDPGHVPGQPLADRKAVALKFGGQVS